MITAGICAATDDAFTRNPETDDLSIRAMAPAPAPRADPTCSKPSHSVTPAVFAAVVLALCTAPVTAPTTTPSPTTTKSPTSCATSSRGPIGPTGLCLVTYNPTTQINERKIIKRWWFQHVVHDVRHMALLIHLFRFLQGNKRHLALRRAHASQQPGNLPGNRPGHRQTARRRLPLQRSQSKALIQLLRQHHVRLPVQQSHRQKPLAAPGGIRHFPTCSG